MNHAAAIRLLTEAEQAVTNHGFSVGHDVHVQVGSALEGSGAAALLWLPPGHTGRAADVVAALKDSGLWAVPQTMASSAPGVVDWLRNAGKVELRRMHGD